MSLPHAAPPEKIRIGAGTAVKLGFFAALGAFLFALILYVVLGIVALVLFAAGALPFLERYFG